MSLTITKLQIRERKKVKRASSAAVFFMTGITFGAASGELESGPLSRSLYRGAVKLESREPTAHVITSPYAGEDGLGLRGTLQDQGRVVKWTEDLGREGLIANMSIGADREMIQSTLESCREGPTFLYMNGEVEYESHGDGVYLLHDCSVPDASGLLNSSGIPLTLMRDWILRTPFEMRLVILTDMCYCTNFLRLPYVARKEKGIWKWQATEEYQTRGTDIIWDENKVILYFAATEKSSPAYAWSSIGGIFTRASATRILQCPAPSLASE
ncbi:hypothetical protein RhiJN_23706 [Ceratobasidium sp. AG-Ba]|nr:hypothetical protein RhiJN_23706 [Ceratobasidium sp. AG-Ba]